MKSIVLLPMFLEGNLWGFFSLDDCRRERTFSKDETDILTSAGMMITSAVNRNIQTVKMREADYRIQIMFDTCPLACCFIDKDYNVIDCNKRSLDLFKLPDKQEFFLWYDDLSPEYQPNGELSIALQRRYINEAFETGYNHFEWVSRIADGEEMPSEVTIVAVKHGEEDAVVLYIRDMRSYRKMLDEKHKAEVAEESNKAKSEFLARMSHEIRTPMNAILGITEIELQNEMIPHETRESLNRIYNSGDLLLSIINDILDLSKIESGKLELTLTQYEIASLIHDTVQINKIRYESKPIEFILDVGVNIPAVMTGDELRIRQILNNILSNAFKYTGEGTINLSVSAEPQGEDPASDLTLVFRVSDTGQGMTKEQVEKLGREE
jgi:signal transduction histidine kinase